MKPARIIVGMSGGVDSSVTAAILKREGFEVIGVTLKLYVHSNSPELVQTNVAISDARKVADHLGIEHLVIDQEEIFKTKIVSAFIDAYKHGKTPLPCVVCNREIKMAVFYDLLQKLDGQGMATGHYARCIKDGDITQLHQASDPKRDQSFFLFDLFPHYLDVLRFPLGHLSKDKTREYARLWGIPVFSKPDSQDLCFMSKNSYKDLFPPRTGDIFHEDGQYLGKHQGTEHYTIGQRQGLGVGGHHNPLYVVELNSELNKVIVGPKSSIACSIINLAPVNWLASDLQTLSDPTTTHKVLLKIRSAGAPVPALVTVNQGTKQAVVELLTPECGIAPGQACVFYQGTRLLGGGWIVK